jgi:hypothetical protein
VARRHLSVSSGGPCLTYAPKTFDTKNSDVSPLVEPDVRVSLIRLSRKRKVAGRHRFTITVPAASEPLQTQSLDMSVEAHSRRRAERTLTAPPRLLGETLPDVGVDLREGRARVPQREVGPAPQVTIRSSIKPGRGLKHCCQLVISYSSARSRARAFFDGVNRGLSSSSSAPVSKGTFRFVPCPTWSLKRLLPGIRVPAAGVHSASELALGKMKFPLPALDLVAQELEVLRDVDNPRLLRMPRPPRGFRMRRAASTAARASAALRQVITQSSAPVPRLTERRSPLRHRL